MSRKKMWVLAVLAVAIFTAFGVVSSNAASKKEDPATKVKESVPSKAASNKEDSVAKVNGVGIKAAALNTAFNNFIENQKAFGAAIKEEEKSALKKDILNELISAELLYQASQKAGLKDLSKDVDTQIENIKKGFGSEEEFLKVLKDRGVELKDLKEDVKRGVYINAYLEKDVFPNLAPLSEEDRKKEFEANKEKLNIPDTVRASHVLIKVGEKATPEERKAAKEKIDALRAKIVSGEDFEKVAKENSEDGSSKTGGDLGYFKKGDMVKPFEEAAFGLEKDQLSAVIETQFGYHIIKVTDKKPAHTLTYDEVSKDIEQFLINKNKRDAVNKNIEALKKNAKIEVL